MAAGEYESSGGLLSLGFVSKQLYDPLDCSAGCMMQDTEKQLL